MQKKTLILLISIFIIAVILMIGLLNVLGIPVYPISREYCGCHDVIPDYFFLSFGILLIFAAMPISYYFSSKKMEEKLDKQIGILSNFLNKKSKNNKQMDINFIDEHPILKFLNPGERIILEKLLEEGGSILQSKISRTEGMTKLKAHRAVRDLKRKKIINIERYGKTNRIFLTEDVRKTLNM